MNVGTYVMTTVTPSRWSMQKYAGQRGVVIGRRDSLEMVRMNDASLHDRTFNGQRCCGFAEADLHDITYVIEEQELT